MEIELKKAYTRVLPIFLLASWSPALFYIAFFAEALIESPLWIAFMLSASLIAVFSMVRAKTENGNKNWLFYWIAAIFLHLAGIVMASLLWFILLLTFFISWGLVISLIAGLSISIAGFALELKSLTPTADPVG